VDPRAGLDDVEKRKFLIVPGLRTLGRPARSQSLYRLHYPGPVPVFDGIESGNTWILRVRLVGFLAVNHMRTRNIPNTVKPREPHNFWPILNGLGLAVGHVYTCVAWCSNYGHVTGSLFPAGAKTDVTITSKWPTHQFTDNYGVKWPELEGYSVIHLVPRRRIHRCLLPRSLHVLMTWRLGVEATTSECQSVACWRDKMTQLTVHIFKSFVVYTRRYIKCKWYFVDSDIRWLCTVKWKECLCDFWLQNTETDCSNRSWSMIVSLRFSVLYVTGKPPNESHRMSNRLILHGIELYTLIIVRIA
jgi:hypothetical protein